MGEFHLDQGTTMSTDFWSESTIAVVGAGSWGSVLAQLAAKNCKEVRLWVRTEEQAREINSTRANSKYFDDSFKFESNLTAFSEANRLFEKKIHAIIWALPSNVCRERAKEFAPYIDGSEIILHATKGVEEGTLKRISEVLAEELPARRIGVISGPNLAKEVAMGEPSGTVVSSPYQEAVEAGMALLEGPYFRVYSVKDIVGVEWAGTLKNILAIASGCLGALEMGQNTRSLLISRGLAEMVRFSVSMGGEQATFLGLAGVGDLLATCGSPLSRNYQVGELLAQGQTLEQALAQMGKTAEGVRTTRFIWEFAQEKGISMPITEAVYHLIRGEKTVEDVINGLMAHPKVDESA